LKSRFAIVASLIKLFVTLSILLPSSNIYAQGPTAHWYFGDSAGVEFNNYNPSFLLNSNLYFAPEGCAALSNPSGELMYYARPDYVINSNHDTLENGGDLLGSFSSTQGAMFIPNPIDTQITYLITHNGLSHFYSIIRTSEAIPLGFILPSEKNISLTSNATEKTTAVHHKNGKDIWLITKGHQSDTFSAFLITENGIQLNPVISLAQSDSIFGYSGQLKSSPNGRYFAECLNIGYTQHPTQARLYKFNNETGLIHSPIAISDSNLATYGAEFSANSDYVYFSNTLGLNAIAANQYSLASYDSVSISNSKYEIIGNLNFSLQIGIDKKIYGTRPFPYDQHLTCIENPESTGLNLIYEDTAVYLGGRTSRLGLPDFIQSFFHPAYYDYESKCNLPVKFTSYPVGQDSVHWDFGEPSSASNTSTVINPTHDYQNEGFYTVEFIVYADSSSDTFLRDIYVKKSLGLTGSSFSVDVCDTAHVINANHNLTLMKYNWSTGASVDSISITQSGTYFCSMTAFCDSLIDTFNVSFMPAPSVSLGNDTLLCEGQSFTIGADLSNTIDFLWSTGDTSVSIVVDESLSPNFETLDLWLTATNACGTSSDTIRIEFLPQPDVSWFGDSILCDQSEAIVNTPIIDSVTFFMTYTTDDIAYDTLAQPWIIDTHGLYYVHAFNQCDTVVKRAFLSPFNVIDVSLGADSVLCPGDVIKLDAFWPTSSYVWNDGSQDSTLSVSYNELQSAGSAIYTVTIFNGACERIASRTLSVDDLVCDTVNCKFSIPNVFSPNADGINDVLKISNTCTNISYAAAIYNRWGQLIYTDERAQGYSPFTWDGFVNGIAASEGTYFIIIQYEDKVQKGSFSLLKK